MNDEEFLQRFRARVEKSWGSPIELAVSREESDRVALDFSGPIPHITIGADALRYPGLARMFMEYAIFSLKEGREIGQQEFFLYLRRN